MRVDVGSRRRVGLAGFPEMCVSELLKLTASRLLASALFPGRGTGLADQLRERSPREGAAPSGQAR